MLTCLQIVISTIWDTKVSVNVCISERKTCLINIGAEGWRIRDISGNGL